MLVRVAYLTVLHLLAWIGALTLVAVAAVAFHPMPARRASRCAHPTARRPTGMKVAW